MNYFLFYFFSHFPTGTQRGRQQFVYERLAATET